MILKGDHHQTRFLKLKILNEILDLNDHDIFNELFKYLYDNDVKTRREIIKIFINNDFKY